ncbi:hypothetical protein RRF57_010198 [Xylaria bambusicola]|uniref:Uncharacterized protein n=1 Tax=Xylaria bambusicola TaxID=326684 RepID=A0AAN7UKV2_9PEZI
MGERPISAIFGDAFAEASIPEDYTRQNIKSYGIINYHPGPIACVTRVQDEHAVPLSLWA